MIFLCPNSWSEDIEQCQSYIFHAVHSLIHLLECCKLACHYSLGVRTVVLLSCYRGSGYKGHHTKAKGTVLGAQEWHFFLLNLCTLLLLKLQVTNLHLSGRQAFLFSPPEKMTLWRSQLIPSTFPAVFRCCWFILAPAEKITTVRCLFFKIRALPLRNRVSESWLSQSL